MAFNDTLSDFIKHREMTQNVRSNEHYSTVKIDVKVFHINIWLYLVTLECRKAPAVLRPIHVRMIVVRGPPISSTDRFLSEQCIVRYCQDLSTSCERVAC